jgi:acyl carrier protein
MDRHSLQIGETFRPVDETDPDAVSFVTVGKAIRDVDIRITDDSDDQLSAGHIGHIQLHGDSIAECIYGDPEATAELFTKDNWLRTGDCGVFVNEKLVITGRQKDIIIINGQNYYPHDIEEIVARIDGLDLNKVVVAGATPKGGQTEELVAFILYRQGLDDFRPLIDAVRDVVGEQTGIAVDTVIPVPRIPKTTSGKVQRGKLLESYFDGEFDAVLDELQPSEMAEESVDADPLVAELEQICREVAKDRKISADDNLFEVGVSSLTLTEVVLAIDEKYPGKLDISDLFDYPTLREIAAFLKRDT